MSHRRQPRAPVQVTIDGLSADGVATGTDAKGRRWSVRGAAPGSVVAAGGRPSSGILLEVVEPAADAVAPLCAQFGVCGGCQLQAVPLDRQRAEKHAALAATLAPLGGTDHGIEGGAGYAYRNKVELSFGAAKYLTRAQLESGAPKEGRFLGMHAPGRFDRIVDLERCELISAAANAVLARVRADVLGSEFALWDPVAHVGIFRHVVLREATNGVLVSIYTSPCGEDVRTFLEARAPTWGAIGVLWFENDRPADAAIGVLRSVLFGADHVVERLAGLAYRLSPTAFFQVNPAGAELLCARVRDAAGRGGTLVDLYCGTGALGLACAPSFDRVIGIDVNPASIADARTNAAANGVEATFLDGEVERRIGELQIGASPVVIVDPPRTGLHPAALAFVAGIDARVLVYVACRPTSLLRDGLALQEAGWTCTDRWAIDLFPQTGHVEVVSRWVRVADRGPDELR